MGRLERCWRDLRGGGRPPKRPPTMVTATYHRHPTTAPPPRTRHAGPLPATTPPGPREQGHIEGPPTPRTTPHPTTGIAHRPRRGPRHATTGTTVRLVHPFTHMATHTAAAFPREAHSPHMTAPRHGLVHAIRPPHATGVLHAIRPPHRHGRVHPYHRPRHMTVHAGDMFPHWPPRYGHAHAIRPSMPWACQPHEPVHALRPSFGVAVALWPASSHPAGPLASGTRLPRGRPTTNPPTPRTRLSACPPARLLSPPIGPASPRTVRPARQPAHELRPLVAATRRADSASRTHSPHATARLQTRFARRGHQ